MSQMLFVSYYLYSSDAFDGKCKHFLKLTILLSGHNYNVEGRSLSSLKFYDRFICIAEMFDCFIVF
jgi:hypothetical protein